MRRKKNKLSELDILRRLCDSDIDTSDIPEVKDWSRAIVGKFYPTDDKRQIDAKIRRGIAQLDRGEGIPQNQLVARLKELKSKRQR